MVPAAVGRRAAATFFTRNSSVQTPRASAGVVVPISVGVVPPPVTGLFQ